MDEAAPDGRQGPSADAVLGRLLPMIDGLGITRIGDITGLDRVGIPVMQATRPLSLSNSVAQGKGSNPEAAAVSAILEAAECFFAERLSRFATVTASCVDLGIAPALFARHLAEDCPPDWHREAVAWTAATDLLADATRMIPLALVHTDFTFPHARQDAYFAASTSGLAVALCEHDAVLHGLLECFERDALARANRTHGFFQRSRIDPATIGDPILNELLAQMRSAGLLAGLWQVPARCGVPVIWCHLLEEDRGQGTLIPFPAEGSAAGLDPAAAACRAIREAAQSRLSAISGAREDITRLAYPRYPDWDMIEAHRKLLREGPRPVDFAALGEPPEAGTDWLAELVERAASDGLASLLVTRLDTAPLAGLSGVKVLVPELLPVNEA